MAKVLIGEIPYDCRVVQATGVREGVVMIELLEDVGDAGQITGDEGTTFFGKGTMMPAKRDGTHPTTGDDLYRAGIDPRFIGE